MSLHSLRSATCFVCCAFVFFALVPHAAETAPLRSAAQSSPTELFNPVPAPDDIVLPMPCDMSMVLKAVDIPARGLLWDSNFNMGSDTPAEAGLEFYDRRFSAVIAAPFMAQDLPEAWRSLLQTGEDGRTFYFMGKYELSAGQWEAVMGNTCPAPSPENARPKTGISWYDAQEFTRKYTQWLLDNAPQQLPRFAEDDRNTGFIRLPTEAEWEYAARGGSKVRQETLLQEPFHPLEPGTTREDYAVFRTEGVVQEGPLRIGSRRSNPLGLHDMAGNVAEMVQDAFRFSLGGRLHGASGGFVRKGGSYSTNSSGIEPGRREEVALFNARGPVSTSDLGMRVVLSGINTPGGTRMQTLQEQWKNLGDEAALISTESPSTTPSPASPSATPSATAPSGATPVPPASENSPALNQLDALLGAQLDPPTRDGLARLRSRLKDDAVAQERQLAASAESSVRTLLYLSETIRNYGVRHELAYRRMEEIRALGTLKDKELAQKAPGLSRKQIEKAVADFGAAANEQKLAMFAAANFYRGQLDDLLALPRTMVNYNLSRIREELKAEDQLSRNMRQNLQLLETHLTRLRSGRTAELTRDVLIRDILPDHLEKGL